MPLAEILLIAVCLRLQHGSLRMGQNASRRPGAGAGTAHWRSLAAVAARAWQEHMALVQALTLCRGRGSGELVNDQLADLEHVSAIVSLQCSLRASCRLLDSHVVSGAAARTRSVPPVAAHAAHAPDANGDAWSRRGRSSGVQAHDELADLDAREVFVFARVEHDVRAPPLLAVRHLHDAQFVTSWPLVRALCVMAGHECVALAG